MLARTARGESGSAQPSASATCAGPKPCALRSSVPRLPGSDTPWRLQPDRRSPAIPRRAAGGRWRAARRRRGSCARATTAPPSPRSCSAAPCVPAAASSSAMRSLPRSSSTNASTGAMPAARAARSASSPSSTKRPVRLRSLASPSARAALTWLLARLVITPGRRSRPRPAPTRGARRPSRPRPRSRAWPPQRARVVQPPERRHRGAVGEVRRPRHA